MTKIFIFFIFARLVTDVTELKYNSAPNFSSVILVQPSNQATILLLFSHWEMYIQTFLLLFRSHWGHKKGRNRKTEKMCETTFRTRMLRNSLRRWKSQRSVSGCQRIEVAILHCLSRFVITVDEIILWDILTVFIANPQMWEWLKVSQLFLTYMFYD